MMSLRKIALVLSFCALGVLSVQDADAQRRSRGLMNEGGRDFYAVARGAYPFTSITKIGGAGIVGFGYRASEVFRAELELIYGAITAEVDGQQGAVPIDLFVDRDGTYSYNAGFTVRDIEADNDNFLAMMNVYLDMPVFPKQWRVTPYVGFSLGYARTDTTPDYGTAADVASVASDLGNSQTGSLEKAVDPSSGDNYVPPTAIIWRSEVDSNGNVTYTRLTGSNQGQVPSARSVLQQYIGGIYGQVIQALTPTQRTALGLPNQLGWTAGTGANQFSNQQQILGRQLAYAAVATGAVGGIQQAIPVGELQSLVVGAMVGATVDVGHNLFVDTGYRFMYAQKEIRNFHEIRLGIGYNFAINY